jgi:hypothetical protein
LLVKCLSEWKTCKQSLAYCSFFFPDDLTGPCRCSPYERQGSSGQTSLVIAAYQNVRFTRSLHASRTAPCAYVFLHVSGRETRLHAGPWHTRHSRTRRHPLALRLPIFSWISRPFCLYPRPVMRFPNINFFFGVRLSAPRPTPNLEGQGYHIWTV